MATTKNGIPYPSNYNAAADVPEDIKKMAEATDALIDTLKTDVADIKKDIDNIEKEQSDQNTTISDINLRVEDNAKSIEKLTAENTALKEELERQKEDNKLNGLTEDNEGEMLHIENTTGARFNTLEIFGNEKQETREGKNLYNVYDTEGRNFNSTLLKIDDEDKISLEDYTNSSDVTKWIDFNTNISSKIKASTVYYVVTEIFSVSGSGNLTVVSTNATAPGQFTTSVSYNFSALAAGDVKIAQITSREDLSNCVSMLRSFLQFNAGQGGSISFRVSVLEKSVTAEDFKYEKYGESPSFYYPSEVKAAGSNINVFNDEAYKGFVVTQQNYNALEKVDLKLEANKYYVAKIYFEDGTSVAVNNSNFMLYAYKSDGTQSANIPNGIAKMYTNATELVKAKIVANSSGLSTYANKVIKGIKIEEVENADGQATAYSKYGQGCVELKVLNKNFLDIQKNATVEKGGVTVTTDENGVLTLNGTTTTNIYIKLNGKDIVDNNIPNWKKSCFRKGTYKFTSEVLTTTQAGNINAFLRKDVYETEGQYATLYQLMNAKTKTATANILEDTEAVVYLWIARGITLNNAKLKFQIELDNARDIVAHEEQSFAVAVQQPMFSKDKFDLLNKKEKHYIKKLVLDGTHNIYNSKAVGSNMIQFGTSLGFYAKENPLAISNYFKQSKYFSVVNTVVIGSNLNTAYFHIPRESVEGDITDSAVQALLKQKADAGNPVTLWVEAEEPDELDLTDEQIEVLEQIEQATTYKGVTNVYTEDEVGAIIKTNTNVDLKSLINNIQEQLIAE